MNIALIFAGGVGTRMNTKELPKQFIRIHEKPIIIYTLEHFEASQEIDAIVVACIEPYIKYLKRLLHEFSITKVCAVVPGGKTGQESIYHALLEAERRFPEDSLALIHDGVRPIINQKLLYDSIVCAKKFGNAVATCRAQETISAIHIDNNSINTIFDRSQCVLLRAPQTFVIKDILAAHRKASAQGNLEFIDSASMMHHYGKVLHYVDTSYENIKITTKFDLDILKVLLSNQAVPHKAVQE